MELDYLISFGKNIWLFVITPVIGAMGFLIGARIGKNKDDRKIKREIYQRVYEYLDKLGKSIDNGRPINEEFIYQSGRWDGWKIGDIVKSGEDVIIQKQIFDEALKIESAVFSLYGKIDDYSKEITDIIRKIYSEVGTGLNSLSGGGTFCHISPIEMLDEKKREPVKNYYNEGNIDGICIEDNDHGSIKFSFYLYEKSFRSISPSEFIEVVSRELCKDQRYMECAKDSEKIKDNIKDLREKVRIKISDPDPLNETIKDAFVDGIKLIRR